MTTDSVSEFLDRYYDGSTGELREEMREEIDAIVEWGQSLRDPDHPQHQIYLDFMERVRAESQIRRPEERFGEWVNTKPTPQEREQALQMIRAGRAQMKRSIQQRRQET